MLVIELAAIQRGLQVQFLIRLNQFFIGLLSLGDTDTGSAVMQLNPVLCEAVKIRGVGCKQLYDTHPTRGLP